MGEYKPDIRTTGQQPGARSGVLPGRRPGQLPHLLTQGLFMRSPLFYTAAKYNRNPARLRPGPGPRSLSASPSTTTAPPPATGTSSSPAPTTRADSPQLGTRLNPSLYAAYLRMPPTGEWTSVWDRNNSARRSHLDLSLRESKG